MGDAEDDGQADHRHGKTGHERCGEQPAHAGGAQDGAISSSLLAGARSSESRVVAGRLRQGALARWVCPLVHCSILSGRRVGVVRFLSRSAKEVLKLFPASSGYLIRSSIVERESHEGPNQ